MGRLTFVQEDLKSMTGIKSTVLRDVATIIEKFPCEDEYVPIFLMNFVSNNYPKFVRNSESKKNVFLLFRLE